MQCCALQEEARTSTLYVWFDMVAAAGNASSMRAMLNFATIPHRSHTHSGGTCVRRCSCIHKRQRSASPRLGIRYVDALHTQAMQSVKSISCLHCHSAAPYSIHQHQHHRRAQQQINWSLLQGHVGHQLIDLLAPDAMAKLHPTSIDIHSLGCCLHEQALQFMPDSPPSLPAGPLVNRLRHPNHRGDA